MKAYKNNYVLENNCDIDDVLGDIIACMQSPECSDGGGGWPC